MKLPLELEDQNVKEVLYNIYGHLKTISV